MTDLTYDDLLDETNVGKVVRVTRTTVVEGRVEPPTWIAKGVPDGGRHLAVVDGKTLWPEGGDSLVVEDVGYETGTIAIVTFPDSDYVGDDRWANGSKEMSYWLDGAWRERLTPTKGDSIGLDDGVEYRVEIIGKLPAEHIPTTEKESSDG